MENTKTRTESEWNFVLMAFIFGGITGLFYRELIEGAMWLYHHVDISIVIK